jgi:hypothetical protein
VRAYAAAVERVKKIFREQTFLNFGAGQPGTKIANELIMTDLRLRCGARRLPRCW